ncbi:MAG: hypothetical protein CFH19_01258 [Alphaproteobacteria bacterium MarineAlpha5_Bin9]|nr:MAG: hypothetical protein CFH19_01258 [Alphaproteobacteria bacterium MarineAlpha5_Bin9]|tara:strand:- start:8976 stop:9329 length:354 start_codon:yes stop_codon:yes gene_type:complete
MNKKNYISISEVSKLLNINTHVIRYWDSNIEGLSTKLNGSKRRYFNHSNIKNLKILKSLLHTNGKSHYSIITAKNIMKNKNFNIKSYQVKDDKSNTLFIDSLNEISNNLKNLIKLKI